MNQNLRSNSSRLTPGRKRHLRTFRPVMIIAVCACALGWMYYAATSLDQSFLAAL